MISLAMIAIRVAGIVGIPRTAIVTYSVVVGFEYWGKLLVAK